MKLAVFDFDSTLMDGETIDYLAGALGLKEKVAEITEMAMRGEIDFFESLITRVKLLEGLEVEQVEQICRSLPYMPGAKETIAGLKERGYRVVVFSGGFRNATGHAREVLGFDDLTEKNYKEVSEQIQEWNKPGIYKRILTEMCNIESVVGLGVRRVPRTHLPDAG